MPDRCSKWSGELPGQCPLQLHCSMTTTEMIGWIFKIPADVPAPYTPPDFHWPGTRVNVTGALPPVLDVIKSAIIVSDVVIGYVNTSM